MLFCGLTPRMNAVFIRLLIFKYPMKLNQQYNRVLFLAILITFSYSLSSFNSIEKGEVIINIKGLKSDKGELILAIFNDKDDYLKKDFIHKKVKVEKTGDTRVIFTDLPKGEYSVSVIHDENKNGKLDKNAVGIPKESFGFSNVSLGWFGPPSYNSTKFELSDDKVEVTVKLKHLYI